MSDYQADLSKYTTAIDSNALAGAVRYCGIALQKRDSALVSGSDTKELARVRDGFAAKKLGLTPEAADAGIQTVLSKMKNEQNKSRVTFYYLLAESTGTLEKLK